MLRNFVLETCSAPGTATTINLAGAATGRVTFASVFSSGSPVYYFIDDGSQAEWGIGTFTVGTPNTLARTTVIGNTAGSTARLNFSGSTRVYCEVPAERMIYADQNLLVTLPGDLRLNSVNGGQIGGYRNAIINGGFLFGQRGTSFSNPASQAYTLDRWQVVYDGTGATLAVAQFALNQASMLDLGLHNGISHAVTVAGSGNTFRQLRQPIENAMTYAGRTCTLSAWAWCGPSSITLPTFLSQHFGSGGSPSADVTTPTVTWSVTATPTKFSSTFVLPSVSGKVFGTNADDSLLVVFSPPPNAIATLNLAGVQLEPGPVATPFELRPFSAELDACCRFWQQQAQLQAVGYGNAGAGVVGIYPFNTMMRTAPTVTLSGISYNNASAANVAYQNARLAGYQATVTATGFAAASFTAQMNAEFP